MKRRLVYIVATILLLCIEVIIALFVHDNFIRPYVGDILVVVVIYTFIRILIPDKIRILSIYIFCFAALVEVLQLFKIVEILGLSDNRLLSTVIGSTFDIKDIICYAIGCVILIVYECVIQGEYEKSNK